MEARMRSVLGWMRRRLGRLGAGPAKARKRPGRSPSVLESLERRQVLSTATLAPIVALPVQVAPTTTVSAASFASPTTIGVATSATTPATYYGQSVVQPPVATVRVSSVAPVAYNGQPVVGASAGGISATNLDTDYVQDLYRTVLDRVGQPSEIASWVAKMQQGTTIPQVAQGFVNSVEHRQDEVDSYYEEFLHRTPDSMATNWVNSLLSGASEEAVVENILNSPEYQQAHAQTGQLVQGLSQDVLGHPADAAGFAEWESALASGTSRQAVIVGFVSSPEAIDQVIENYYVSYLHREPDLSTSSAWANVLVPNGSATEMAISLLSSPEFVQDSQQA